MQKVLNSFNDRMIPIPFVLFSVVKLLQRSFYVITNILCTEMFSGTVLGKQLPQFFFSCIMINPDGFGQDLSY